MTINPILDVAANRRARKWSSAELLGRALWEMIGQRLFASSPRAAWAWRRMVLRLFGARIGAQVRLHPTVIIAVPWNIEIGDEVGVGDGVLLYSLGLIRIGARATISQRAHICAGSHAFREADMPLLKQPIAIGEGAWICADAFIGPNIAVGPYAVIGARAVVVRHVESGAVMAGNPARRVGTR